jgi:hypothetical protein
MKKIKLSKLPLQNNYATDDDLILQTKTGYLFKLKSEKFNNKPLPSNDFNLILNQGVYFISNDCYNLPAGSGPYGLLTVSGFGNVLTKQEYYDTSCSIYIRQYSSEMWSNWVKVL